ncbi:hypothetical protein [Croceicoccus sp. YJ47]|uniref:hypothetical protein n=1 Tax=Croceicoccus sp. YJ47 TaxID=2798724 RepID=UPI0019223FE1|nr:hypothetical protein [Croceicoccus sp. YJ47]QQN74099.1 hypothetical protein JD971_15425 [Croceicoccus sp. YJ47]
MATIETLTGREKVTVQPYCEVGKAVVRLVDCGTERFLRSDNYGRSARDIPGKLSQTIQPDKAAFERLVDLGKRHF